MGDFRREVARITTPCEQVVRCAHPDDAARLSCDGIVSLVGGSVYLDGRHAGELISVQHQVEDRPEEDAAPGASGGGCQSTTVEFWHYN